MSMLGGFGQGLQNSAQAMMLKQMMLRGQQAAPGAAQTPTNPYSGPQQGGPGGYDPQAMESAMDAALGKQSGPPQIQSSGMTAQAGTQLPPPNILAGLKALMMGQGGY